MGSRPAHKVCATASIVTSSGGVAIQVRRLLIWRDSASLFLADSAQGLQLTTAGLLGQNRSLFDNHVCVRSADAERTHAGAAWVAVGSPLFGFGVDVETATVEFELRIRRIEVDVRRNLAMVHGEHGLYQPCNPGRMNQMSDIGFRGPKRAFNVVPFRRGRERFFQRSNFDRIALAALRCRAPRRSQWSPDRYQQNRSPIE